MENLPMDSLDLNFHGIVSLLFCIVQLPLILSAILSSSLAKRLQKNLVYLLTLDICWNILAFIQELPPEIISDKNRHIIYISGALCWVQYGYAVFRSVAGIAGESARPFWEKLLPAFKALNFLGIAYILFFGFFENNFYSEPFKTWFGFTTTNTIFATVAILVFFIFPAICAAAVSFQSFHSATAKIHKAIFITLVTSIVGGLTFDSILPALHIFFYSESASVFMFFVSIVLYRANSAISQRGIDLNSTLAGIVKNLDEGVLVMNPSGRIEFSNAAASEILSHGEGPVLHRQISAFLPDLKLLGPFANRPLKANGKEAPVTVSVFPLYANGIPFGYKALLKDSNQDEAFRRKFSRLQAEFNDERDSIRLKIMKLQRLYGQQQIFLRSLLNNLPARLWAKNLTGAYTQQNEKDVQFRGDRLSRIDSPAFTPLEIQAMEGPGRIVSSLESESDSDGKRLWLKYTVIPLYDENHHVKGVLNLMEDTSAFHELEEERNQLRENLLKASNIEDLSSVTGGLAHDFNNILSGIIGYCELAQATIPQTEDCGKARKYLENVRKSSDNAAKLVKRTYDQLNEQRASQTTEAENFNVGLVFDEVKNALSATVPSNIRIVKDSSDDMVAFGNQTDFHRIMLNMGKNAILAMKGGGTLTYACRPVEISEQKITQFSNIPAGSYLFITVADTGSGMSPDIVSHIFTPYFTTRAPGEGMGLGLSVALKLIKMAKAFINLKTTIGKGTTFELYWPTARNK